MGLNRKSPFANGPKDTPTDILQRINECKLDFASGNWASVSNEAKDLVRKMLHMDPHRRPTATQLLQHTWLTARLQLPNHPLTLQDSSQLKVSLHHTMVVFKTCLFVAFSIINMVEKQHIWSYQGQHICELWIFYSDVSSLLSVQTNLKPCLK